MVKFEFERQTDRASDKISSQKWNQKWPFGEMRRNVIGLVGDQVQNLNGITIKP